MFFGVAPPAGAWIETRKKGYMMGRPTVAPPAGAWIETHPQLTSEAYHQVAPPAGAWIETVHEDCCKRNKQESRPLRARGLKPYRAF